MRLILSVALALLSLTNSVYAQSDDCNIKLFKQFRELSVNQVTTYAFVQQLNDQLSASDRSQIGASLLIDGIQIALNGGQANEIASSFARQTGTEWNQDKSMTLLTSGLSDHSVEAYRTCVNGQQIEGPRIFPFDATATGVAIKIRWIAPTGAPETSSLDIEQHGGKPSVPWPTSWKSGQDFTRFYSRTPGQDLTIIANIGGNSDAVDVPYVPRLEVKFVSKNERIDPPTLETDTWGHSQGPNKDCVRPTFGAVIDPGTVKSTITAWGGPLDGSSYARVDIKQPNKICWSEFLRPLKAHEGGVIQFHIDYTEVTPTYRVIPPKGPAG